MKKELVEKYGIDHLKIDIPFTPDEKAMALLFFRNSNQKRGAIVKDLLLDYIHKHKEFLANDY